ncbi:DUF885 domain-containing protein [Pacificimonas flava]|uniref:DUF885 domain-containing protein n=2 Tax=Pacificimonas TaxID=1960290 RepID=A0A219B720_9SPHN|nr:MULTISPECIES: DUF885 family protein [Pacificimonas]MBZ6379188.1 DUF885 domain-containing protein [Pacificimonas aurantium]OWV33589.1 DUF885 domain-containing protein [Pacificimonas flava]
MFTRRTFLESAAAGALFARAGLAFAAQPGTADAALQAMLQRHAEDMLARSPQEATGAGYDIGDHAALRGMLDDRSLAGRARDRAAVASARVELETSIDRTALSPRSRLDYDIAHFVYENLAFGLGSYGYMDLNLRPSPYVVSQMNGAYYWLPDFIGSRHPLETAADREAWISRLRAYAEVIDQETQRIRHDALQGVSPPGFVIDRTIPQIELLRDTPVLESNLTAPAIRRAREAGLADLQRPAQQIFTAEVVPALNRQVEMLRSLRADASDIGGVWRLPEGDRYYAGAVRSNTTSDISPGELHREGLAQCEDLIARIDTLLRAQGMTSGTVGERIAALDRDPRFLLPATDAGREALLERAQGFVEEAVARLPQAFGNTHVNPLRVRRIPEAIENGAPGAFYSGGADGEPGIYSLNLKNPAEHPLWRLATLTHHEAVPGHHFQYSVLSTAGDLPLFRQIVRFSAYTEGWALYAQQVAREMGVFEGEPFAVIGELQSQLFRAARIVVDTGMHHERWSREQAVDWMVNNAGEQRESTEREVVRYSVYPGQACSFKVGANSIVAAREAARSRLGASFDVRNFHDLVLESGPMPMAVLAQAVEQWDGGPAAGAATDG